MHGQMRAEIVCYAFGHWAMPWFSSADCTISIQTDIEDHFVLLARPSDIATRQRNGEKIDEAIDTFVNMPPTGGKWTSFWSYREV
jgi:hypothetical protein